eukprot:gnl/MRDRNA2_/MRDRNA2_95580_c0_seq1.p1 gnl/MRDRNA2_/MRDRNA2_95580_c0~~gnl/MRDRNA2_/MRDRNA2_95580_c0_seq1.p1  ORF type:complete len:919 (+),score=239.47 gnl/MRDRNA2_/MRDRNA2_95580_c0_seq1:78-2834(+)
MAPAKGTKKMAVDSPDDKVSPDKPPAKRRRPMEKKTEAKSADETKAKNADETKAETPKPNEKKAKKSDDKKTDTKKSDDKKADTKKSEETKDVDMQNAALVDEKDDEVETQDADMDENELEDECKAMERITTLWSSSEGASVTDFKSPAFDPQCEAANLTGKQLQEFALIAAVLDSGKGCGVALTNMFRRVIQCGSSSADPVTDMHHIIAILLNRFPALSHKVVSQAIAETFGLKFDRNGVMGEGDLPDIALAGRRKQKSLFQSNRLTNASVIGLLQDGANHANQKDLQPFIKTLGQSKEHHHETSHLVQLLLGRTLVARRLVLQSLAQAFVWTRLGNESGCKPTTRVFANVKEMAMMMVRMENAVTCAYSSTGCNADILVQALLAGCGPDALAHACSPGPMVPVLPMKPAVAESIPSALGKLNGPFTADWLYAGERVHVHVASGGETVKVYSTSMVPWEQDRVDEFSESLRQSLKNVSCCILDVIVPKKPRVKKLTLAEKAAVEAGEFQPREEPKLCLVVLDIVTLNGEPLVNRTLRGRRAELSACIEENEQVKHARTREFPEEASPTELGKFLNEAIATDAKSEHRGFGLVLKQLDGDCSYHSGCHSDKWQVIQKPVLTGEEADKAVFACLTEEEKEHLADADTFHFAVISARRTQTPEGVADILCIQKQFTTVGVQPVWYVDAKSLSDYQALGLNAIDGGKLIPARNKALDDAQKANKVCVQCSDDIGKWQLLHGVEKGTKNQGEANANWRMSDLYVCSPVAAARFLLAKMRLKEAKLGGVFPLANAGRSFVADAYTYHHFILGDFFVAEPSDVRFDKNMTLKEDYDYTCSHLYKYGAVVRCNRLLITAKHETNHGGACSTRDSEGKEEQKNIAILKEKWPGVFCDNGRRAHQVVMRWNSLKRAEMKDPDTKVTW